MDGHPCCGQISQHQIWVQQLGLHLEKIKKLISVQRNYFYIFLPFVTPPDKTVRIHANLGKLQQHSSQTICWHEEVYLPLSVTEYPVSFVWSLLWSIFEGSYFSQVHGGIRLLCTEQTRYSFPLKPFQTLDDESQNLLHLTMRFGTCV